FSQSLPLASRAVDPDEPTLILLPLLTPRFVVLRGPEALSTDGNAPCTLPLVLFLEANLSAIPKDGLPVTEIQGAEGPYRARGTIKPSGSAGNFDRVRQR